MGTRHLTSEDFAAYLDGISVDRALAEHLDSCARCRAEVETLREVRTLLSPEAAAPAGEHPDEDVLVAWLERALSPSRVPEVEGHLRRCDLCHARLERLREATSSGGIRTPWAMVAATARRLEKQRRESTASIVVRFLEGMERLTLQLVPGEAVVHHLRRSAMTLEQPALPYLAAGPAVREDGGAELLDQDLDAVAGQHELALNAMSPETAPIIVDAPYRILLDAFRDEEHGARLETRFLDAATRRPMGNLEIEVEPPGGPARAERTDAAGLAVLLVPAGRTRLRVREPFPLSLEIVLQFEEGEPGE